MSDGSAGTTRTHRSCKPQRRVMDVDQHIGSARYVSLTTFKRNGDAVATPVWIAPALPGEPFRPGELVFVSLADAWKVKRLRRDPRVEVRPCDVRGNVTADAPVYAGSGRVLDAPDAVRATKRALGNKYGQWYHVMTGAESAIMKVYPGYRKRVGIALTLDPVDQGTV